MNDRERVEAIEHGLRVTHGLVVELNALALTAVSDTDDRAVEATLDKDGFISGLEIAPTALADYTHIELENMITDVLVKANGQLGEAIDAAMGRYWGPESSWQELPGLSDDW